MPEMAPETKPFYKTSEFYGIVGGALTVFLDQALTGEVSKASLTGAALAGVYALARGLAKLGVAPGKVDEKR